MNGNMETKRTFPPKDQIPEGQCACDYCDGNCCRYFALPIDKPENYQEFDFIRWFLLHENASVFRDGGDLFLLVHNKCKNLGDENRCHVYSKRPQICRDYSSAKCEYMEQNPYEGYFEVSDQVEEYAEAVLGPRPGRAFRSAKNPEEGW